MNKLILIGGIGNKKAYLNISEDEAIKRYINEHLGELEKFDDHVETFYFEDEFNVYDAWEK